MGHNVHVASHDGLRRVTVIQVLVGVDAYGQLREDLGVLVRGAYDNRGHADSMAICASAGHRGTGPGQWIDLQGWAFYRAAVPCGGDGSLSILDDQRLAIKLNTASCRASCEHRKAGSGRLYTVIEGPAAE